MLCSTAKTGFMNIIIEHLPLIISNWKIVFKSLLEYIVQLRDQVNRK